MDVLIAGAGPVGLSCALELGLRGVRVLVVEQNDRGGKQPRAKTTNIRSMAHMRRWGIAQRIREASPLPVDYPADIVFATRLFGHPIAHFENVFFGKRERNPFFPEKGQWIPQYTVEAVIRERLAELSNVEIRFNAALNALREEGDRVRATVADTAAGNEFAVDAAYVVGADGGRSTTRTLLGIQLEGDYAYMANYLAIYRAPGLLDSHPQAKAVSYWLVNADSPAVTGPMDRGDTWFFSTQLPKGQAPYDLETGARKIREAIGQDVEFEILETDTWQAHRLIASTYSKGRIFLAGDACHLHPPMGGYGMNQGIGDAVDLGWKIAAVLQGWGGPALLASYEQERKPVHRMFVQEATENYAYVTHHMVNPTLERDDEEGRQSRALLGEKIMQAKQREFKAIGTVLGYTYAPSPLIVPDGTPQEPLDPLVYVPSARPGALAPHLWLDDGSSLYDRLGQGYTLLVLGGGSRHGAQALQAAAEQAGLPLATVEVDSPQAAELYGCALAIVRPDQHIAWRGSRAPDDAGAVIRTIAGWGEGSPSESAAVAAGSSVS
ncbi:FAD-dependent oxidoreductase [Pigmentiphaga humi]|uniref:FAD-dependent oxidoreductase n=1 Tax=Pigmentiphaga humi TaxID=2478468 RepID=UPI001FE90915|nr:FAD-dependent oxidoreductase [Pigmentiphaga humi]